MRRRPLACGVTLIELLLCLALISMIVIGFFSIDIFSRHHLLTADRRAKVQNDLSLVMEHMSKKIMSAIGDSSQYPLVLKGNCLAVVVDSNQNGRYDSGVDRVKSYCCSGKSSLNYCDDAQDVNSPQSCKVNREVLSNHFASCIDPSTVIVNTNLNYVVINLTACWNTTTKCGTGDNPSVNMNSRVYMPAISVN